MTKTSSQLNTLWNRIRSRKLVQWAISYLAAAWVALQAIALFGENLGWPGTLFRGAAVLLAGGLAAVVVLAWFHGERGRQRVTLLELGLLLTLLVLTSAALFAVRRGHAAESAWTAVSAAAAFAGSPSIAILPFANSSADPEAEYLSEGISEDIATSLGKLARVTVVSTAATRRYKGSHESPASIAVELGGVGHVLTGSVQQWQHRVRVTAQLVDGGTNVQVWAESYERDFADLLGVQSEIAQQVARALGAHLREVVRGGEAVPTSSLNAYDLLLKAREHARRGTSESNDIAIQLYRRAIAEDPGFALAYAELADRYTRKLVVFGDPQAWPDTALVLARRAVALDSSSSEAHQAVGYALLNKGSLGSARKELEAAVRLDPNNAAAVRNLAVVASQTGRFDLALPMYRRALELDPLSITPLVNAANTLARLGRITEAEGLLERARLLEPDNRTVHLVSALLALARVRSPELPELPLDDRARGLAATFPQNSRALATAGSLFLAAGNLIAAHEHYEAAYAISPVDYEWVWEWDIRTALAYTRWQLGDPAGASKLLDELERDIQKALDAGAEFYSIHYDRAVIHLIRDQRREFLRWLERAISLGWTPSPGTVEHPLLAGIAGDPEFRRIMTRAERSRAELLERLGQWRW
jgi:eukaryotic-like serine/threonine-protein kinase